MTVDLDDTDWLVLVELQRDGRISYTELARRVHLSPSAVTERVRRLESSGVVTGYRAEVDLAAVGVAVQAVVRLRYAGNHHEPFRTYVAASTHVLECLRVTGEDCYVLQVVATSMGQLQEHVDDLARFGDTSTSVVYSRTLPARGPLARP